MRCAILAYASRRSQHVGTSVEARDPAASSPSKKTTSDSPNGATDAPDAVEAAFTIDRSLIERYNLFSPYTKTGHQLTFISYR